MALAVVVAALTVGAPIASADPWFNDRSSIVRPDDRAVRVAPGPLPLALQRNPPCGRTTGGPWPGAVASAGARNGPRGPTTGWGRGPVRSWDLHHRRPLGEHLRLGRCGDRSCQRHGLCPASGGAGSSDGRDADERRVVTAMSDSVSGDRRGPPMCGPLRQSTPARSAHPGNAVLLWPTSGVLQTRCRRTSPSLTHSSGHAITVEPFPTRPDGTRRHLPDPDGMWVHDPGGEQGAALRPVVEPFLGPRWLLCEHGANTRPAAG